uniref:Uncharacterized protein n=1 Tax=Meloidogyne incognita TaxID=6306 RepID=A0A914MBD8_MELIC
MHPGEGTSGSQPEWLNLGEDSGIQQPLGEDEFTQLREQILPLLKKVGDHEKLEGIVPRVIKNPTRRKEITNVRIQYYNLVYAYLELLANTNEIIASKFLWLTNLHQNMAVQ